jgi:SAM-dependent methyltransferase
MCAGKRHKKTLRERHPQGVVSNFALHGLTGEFFLGNIEELDTILPKDYQGKFDLIYSFGVIHHTPNPKKVFEQMPYFLKQGGEVRCMLYSRFSYKLFWLMK